MQPLQIEAVEVDRVDVKGRIAAVAHRVGDDLAREREQQARALDHRQRLDLLGRDVLDAEHAGVMELELEDDAGPLARAAFEQQVDLVVGGGDLPAVDVDLKVEARRLLAEAARRVRVLEREVLDVLRHDREARRRRVPSAVAVLFGHRLNSQPLDLAFRRVA